MADGKWVMHIVGPDDVLEMPDEITALREANQHNKQFAKLMEKELSPESPYCVAVAKNVRVEEV